MARLDPLASIHTKLDQLLSEVRELRAATGGGAALMDWDELKTMVPYSRNHIARLEDAGKFPKRRRLGDGMRARVGWLRSDVTIWIAGLPKGR